MKCIKNVQRIIPPRPILFEKSAKEKYEVLSGARKKKSLLETWIRNIGYTCKRWKCEKYPLCIPRYACMQSEWHHHLNRILTAVISNLLPGHLRIVIMYSVHKYYDMYFTLVIPMVILVIPMFMFPVTFSLSSTKYAIIIFFCIFPKNHGS